MGIGFTLTTLKALNGSGINCFVLRCPSIGLLALSYNCLCGHGDWPGSQLFGVPNVAGLLETYGRASSHAFFSTVTPICSVADLLRSNPNKPVFQERDFQNREYNCFQI